MKRKHFLVSSVALVSGGLMLGGILVSPASAAEEGQAIFQKNCVSCHGKAGMGDGPASKMLKPQPKPFDTALKGKSAEEITKVIKEGGKAAGLSAMMPAYGKKLDEKQLHELVEYVQGLAKK